MKTFRTYQPDQLLLLPPALNDWLPKGHLVHFISDVVDSLDLSEVYHSYNQEKGGQPPYHPLMMVKVLCYACCIGMRSSRQIERATWENIAFRVLTADQHPDHDSLASFRKKHLNALSNLFQQVLEMTTKANLIDLNHVAVDGTKVNANAGRDKTYSLTRVKKKEERLKKLVDEILSEADRIDREEDEKYGDRSTYQLPQEYRDRASRLKKIQELKEKMEKEAKEAEEQAEKERELKAQGSKRKGRPRKNKPAKELIRNLTDYDSRIMHLTSGNWAQAFNAQAVVDSKNQIIIASDVTNQGNDQGLLQPMLRQAIKNTGRKPKIATADRAYYKESTLRSKEFSGINILVPPQDMRRERKPGKGKRAFPYTTFMKTRIELPENKELYKRRKTIVEPVFGQIKESVLSFNRFTFRGLANVKREWDFLCAIHNLMKLYRSGWQPA